MKNEDLVVDEENNDKVTTINKVSVQSQDKLQKSTFNKDGSIESKKNTGEDEENEDSTENNGLYTKEYFEKARDELLQEMN